MTPEVTLATTPEVTKTMSREVTPTMPPEVTPEVTMTMAAAAESEAYRTGPQCRPQAPSTQGCQDPEIPRRVAPGRCQSKQHHTPTQASQRAPAPVARLGCRQFSCVCALCKVQRRSAIDSPAATMADATALSPLFPNCRGMHSSRITKVKQGWKGRARPGMGHAAGKADAMSTAQGHPSDVLGEP